MVGTQLVDDESESLLREVLEMIGFIVAGLRYCED